MTRLVFVTGRHDTHSDRFSELFSTVSSSYARIDWDGGSGSHPELGAFANAEELRLILEAHPSLVVSGPLDSVTQALAGGSYRHVGISWATDVMVSARASFEALTLLEQTVSSLELVITDNYATENSLVALGVDEDRILRVPWGPEEPAAADSGARAKFGIPRDRFVVFYPRSLSAHYQPEVFVEAFHAVASENPELHAVFIETGNARESVRDALASRGLSDRVTWLAPLPAPDFNRALASMDALCVTPMTDGTSVTVMQAMAQGVPVVSSLTNGSSEWVIDGVTGWSFPAGDAIGLARALRDLVASSPERVQAITTHARRLVGARAGWRRSAEKIAESIRKYLEI